MGKDREGNELPKGITQRDNGTYRGRFQYEGVIYTLDNPNLKTLIREMEDMKYEVIHGVKGKGDNIKLDAWFDVWLNVHKKKNIKESTYVRYSDFYNRYIKKSLGKRRIATITPLILERLFQDMAERGYSTKTIRDVYHILNGMFKYAKYNRMVVHNPCEGVCLPKTKTKDIRVLTLEEQHELVRHAKGRLHENLILVALGTGMRAGELLGLSWDDVDFKKREIHVTKTLVYIKDPEINKFTFKYQTPKTKNGTRIIPMQEGVYQALKKQHIQIKEMKLVYPNWSPLEGFSKLVFATRTGKPITERIFRAVICNVVKAIDKERLEVAQRTNTEYHPIPHIYPHALRHTFATRCFEAGIDAKVVQGYLGHYSIAITMDLYTHVTNDKAKSEMEKLNNLFAG